MHQDTIRGRAPIEMPVVGLWEGLRRGIKGGHRRLSPLPQVVAATPDHKIVPFDAIPMGYDPFSIICNGTVAHGATPITITLGPNGKRITVSPGADEYGGTPWSPKKCSVI
jgi:hypothetical protein